MNYMNTYIFIYVLHIKMNIVITGSNKGIGLGIIDRILKDKTHFYKIILCSRTSENGKSAIGYLIEKHGEEIVNEKVNIEQLDITDKSSVSLFINTIKQKYNGRVDCLVNNAGIAVKDEFNEEVVSSTLNTNFHSTVEFTEALLKNEILLKDSKIIFIASELGRSGYLNNKDIISKLENIHITYDELCFISNSAVQSIKNNQWEEDGWPIDGYKAYSLSKILLITYATSLSNRKDILENGIQVYSCSPGWVRSDMGGPQAIKSIEEGVECPVFLINLEHSIAKHIQGEFFYDCKVQPKTGKIQF